MSDNLSAKPEIVVGIDFGTTYSGFSWASKAGLQEIHVLDDWTTTVEDFSPTNPKARTWISYRGSTPDAFGFEANIKPFKWFKILLQPDSYLSESEYLAEAQIHLRQLGKTVDEVIADYLGWIWGQGLKHIKQYQGADFQNAYRIRVVLTVPAAWTPRSKDRTMQAALKAGIPGPIELVSEPEAGALATLKDRNENETLEVGDTIVICDAGGGTVDLISYQVVDLQPLKLKECAVGEGGLCGSVFLDMGFEAMIKAKVGADKYDRVRPRDKRKMIQQFEYSIKRNFDGNMRKNFTVHLDGLTAAGGTDSDDEEEDALIIKGAEVGKIFDDVCSKIDVLVENQVKQITSKGLRVKSILLVGGFGGSTYMYNRLDLIYRDRGIKVLKTKDAWSAVCRGATAWGLNNKAFVSRVARYSYGQPVTVPFDSTLHDYRDRFFDDSEDIWRADNQMNYLIRKGDDLKVGAVLSHKAYSTIRESMLQSRGTIPFTRKLWYCDDDRPPRRKEDHVLALCELEFELESSKMLTNSVSRVSPADNATYRDIHFSMELELGTTNLTFSVKFAGETVAKCRSKYVEKFDD